MLYSIGYQNLKSVEELQNILQENKIKMRIRTNAIANTKSPGVSKNMACRLIILNSVEASLRRVNHMNNGINMEKIKKIINDSDKDQVVIFINCTIENITITKPEANFKEGEHHHHYHGVGRSSLK